MKPCKFASMEHGPRFNKKMDAKLPNVFMQTMRLCSSMVPNTRHRQISNLKKHSRNINQNNQVLTCDYPQDIVLRSHAARKPSSTKTNKLSMQTGKYTAASSLELLLATRFSSSCGIQGTHCKRSVIYHLFPVRVLCAGILSPNLSRPL